MGYISNTSRNRTDNLFHPKREPIALGHSDGQDTVTDLFTACPWLESSHYKSARNNSVSPAALAMEFCSFVFSNSFSQIVPVVANVHLMKMAA